MMFQTPYEYVREVYCAWQKKNKDAINSSLNAGYKQHDSDLEFFCGPLDFRHFLPALHDYLSVADAIDIKAGQGETAHSVVYDYFYNEESEAYRSKVFIVVCCPSMTGKPQFSFTLPMPTIYIPFVPCRNICKNFTPLLELLRVAAYRDLAFCYRHYATQKEEIFDPIISASSAAFIFSGGRKSYVLGFFTHIASLIRECRNAADSTRAIIDYMKKMKETAKIKPVSWEYFSKIYAKYPYCVVLDEFPSNEQSQIVALFIRNILRSHLVALIVMTTSAQIATMITPESPRTQGVQNYVWAVVIRRLPPVTLLPLLKKHKFRNLEGFLNFLKQFLLRILSDTSTLDAFIDVIKEQLTYSRPGICRIIIDSLLEMILPGFRDKGFAKGFWPDDPTSLLRLVESKNISTSMLVMFSSFIDDFQNSLYCRKSMMFDSLGIIGSLSLIFLNFHINSDLFGSTATSHIINHLYYLSDPLQEDSEDQFDHMDNQPVSFKLYVRTIPLVELVGADAVRANKRKLAIKSMQLSLYKACLEARSVKKSTENIGTFAQINRESPLANTNPASQPKNSHTKPALVENNSAATTRIPLYLSSDCRVEDGFKPMAEIPSPDTELFCYLCNWSIRNSFILTGGDYNPTSETYCSLINFLHSHVKDYVSNITAIAPGNRLNNDGTVAQALAAQCVVFSSHVFAEYDQNGIHFFYRVLRNCDIESTSTSIDHIDEIGDNMQNFETVGPSGRLIIESPALATKMSQIRVPYLGPIDCAKWSNLNRILPNVFGNVFRCPCKSSIGISLDFDYHSEQGCKRAKVEIKDFRTSLGASDLRKIIRRISEEVELHFLFCGPVARSLNSSQNCLAGREDDPMVPESIYESELGQKQSKKDIFMPYIGEVLISDEDSIEEEIDPNQTLEEKAQKNTVTLLSALRSKKVNLYYVKRSLNASAINFTVVTLYESSENEKSSIIIPFIPVTVDDVSTREKSILLEREHKMLPKIHPDLFHPRGLTTLREFVAEVREAIRKEITDETNT